LAAWLESGPHGAPHMCVYFTMALMYSPDDPLFWMHHCNIDRIYKFWIDCNEYETVSNDSISFYQYEAANPMNSKNPPAQNPYTEPKQPYSVSADSKIPFYYQSSGDSKVFPADKWPTPRQLWGKNPVERGYDGMWNAYGSDALVTKFGSSCTKNVKWSLVHQTATPKKRSEEEDKVFSHPSAKHLISLGDKFQEEIAKGRSSDEVLHSMLMDSCESKPKIQLTDRVLRWISMNNLHISDFDTHCDKPSERFEQQFGTKSEDQTQNSAVTAVPLWVIISASVGSALFMIAVITLIVVYIRKSREQPSSTAYVQMNDK